jgi:AraC-like DNA-binding protein
MQSTLLVKNMVCHRCILTVESILHQQAIPYQKVTLGEIHLTNELQPPQMEQLISQLEKVGFELIDDRRSALVEKIKQLVIKKARQQLSEAENKQNLSNLLATKLHHEYTYLSSLFSSIEGRTIENYFIEQRIENVKELLVYGQLTLSEIAIALEYSSTAHLSKQFKKTTGLTPSHFIQLSKDKRKALDKI